MMDPLADIQCTEKEAKSSVLIYVSSTEFDEAMVGLKSAAEIESNLIILIADEVRF